MYKIHSKELILCLEYIGAAKLKINKNLYMPICPV